MKPRARWITIGAAVLAAVFVAVLVVAHWDTVRDHVEAWHFQLTRETKTLEPVAEGVIQYSYELKEHLLHRAANALRSSVIFDPMEVPALESNSFSRRGAVIFNNSWPLQLAAKRLPEEDITPLLEKHGYRVLEQRFPRRAYVVIRDNQ